MEKGEKKERETNKKYRKKNFLVCMGDRDRDSMNIKMKVFLFLSLSLSLSLSPVSMLMWSLSVSCVLSGVCVMNLFISSDTKSVKETKLERNKARKKERGRH